MFDKNTITEFNNIFPRKISEEFLFSLDSYLLFLEGLTINPFDFYNHWSDINSKYMINKYWKQNTKLDWKWSLSFPLFSLLEKYIENFDKPIIIGLSGLPGSGKSTLGIWVDSLARELDLDIKVISLDDFYLPGKEMDIAIKGNPWNVPRGFPGSHSIDLLSQSLDAFLKTGFLKCPIFEKSLRQGKGDRSGWSELTPKVLILEGWFVGCEPEKNLSEIDYLLEGKCNLCLSQAEKDFRTIIQESLIPYTHVWNKFEKIWHLKSSRFDNTIAWKTQQEEEMIKAKGSGLKDNSLKNFIRMIQACIPQESFSRIKSNTTIEINQHRRINKIHTKKYIF